MFRVFHCHPFTKGENTLNQEHVINVLHSLLFLGNLMAVRGMSQCLLSYNHWGIVPQGSAFNAEFAQQSDKQHLMGLQVPSKTKF